MIKRLLTVIVLPLTFATSRATAQTVDCANAATTVEINFCAEKDFDAADKDLNAAYAAALASTKTRDLDKPYDAKSFEAAMRESQRAWLAYRDADCKDLVAQEWTGGTGAAAAILGCMTEKTAQRTKELRERFAKP